MLKNNSVEQNYNPLTERMSDIRRIVEDSIHRLSMEGQIIMGDFYTVDGNERARGGANHSVAFNERNIMRMDNWEMQRWSWHEIQHGLTSIEQLRLSEEESTNNGLVVFSDEFDDMRKRMKHHFDMFREAGYEFLRQVKERPASVLEISTNEGNLDYASYDETMSLIRGYQCYLEQISTGEEISTDPAEFIEAFQPQDLIFLDLSYRQQLGSKVRQEHPELIAPHIELDDWT